MLRASSCRACPCRLPPNLLAAESPGLPSPIDAGAASPVGQMTLA
jgi:hypothetical protein